MEIAVRHHKKADKFSTVTLVPSGLVTSSVNKDCISYTFFFGSPKEIEDFEDALKVAIRTPSVVED